MANPRNTNGHRRRELRKRVIATETYCAWEHCEWPDEPVNKQLHYLDPKAPEVDEIIPVSLGGDPLARANTRLLHRQRICNQRRGNGTRTPKVVPKPTEYKTSRHW